VSLRADEISSLIQKQIEGFEEGIELKETGRVISVGDGIARIHGLENAMAGELLSFPGDLVGMVLNLEEDNVGTILLGFDDHVKEGDEVKRTGRIMEVPVGPEMVGRVVNALGEPIDGKGPIKTKNVGPIERIAPGVIDRKSVHEPLQTGIKSIDGMIPVGRGQRELIIGDRQTGKSTLAIDTILNQKGKDVICIYCSIGKTYSSLMKIIDLFQEKGALNYTLIVSGIASTSVGEQYLAPYTAAMLGEYYMNHGKDVLVVFDDLTRHAWIYRQISLLLNRAPGREAYPGDIFYIHSQLMERAGQLSDEFGGGAMTFLPIVETLQGDVTGYIPTNLVSMTDGQTYFSSTLFNKGFRPAIDVGLSVSRIGNRAQWPAVKGPSRNLRMDFLHYKELVQMTQLRTTELSKEAQKKLRRGEAITELLIQNKNDPVCMERLVVDMYALNREVLDELSKEEIRKFKAEFYPKICEWFPDLPKQLREGKVIVDETIANLEEAIFYYFNPPEATK